MECALPDQRKSRNSIRLGAPLLQEFSDPLELAQAHAALGYRAAFCPTDLSTNDIPRIHAVRRAFQEQDVLIAEVIAWRNLIPRDTAMRAAAYDFVCERLAIADEVGARCCVTFGGTLDLDTSWTPHPENLSQATFDLIVEIVRHILDDVRPRRTCLALEMMATVFPNSSDSYVALIEAVDRPGLAVHLDPVNLITSPQQYWNSGTLIDECFDKLGQWIASAHAKDIIWRPERGFHLAEGIPGTGTLDFRTYISRLKQVSRDVPLMLEHMSTPEEYQQGYDYICSIEADLGVS
jgi:sugar phosphate isomerase/epimerase